MSPSRRVPAEPTAVVPRPAYPETRQPFTWPTEGVRTWQAPERSYFDECTAGGMPEDQHICRVGVRWVNGRTYGCDCRCHDECRV
ncbi:hypothetical protein [Streptacidiphilus sp. MAP5-3]|jgi:hypothetical protein|uniref:hypothetical protein n=1 Tax=unclassified Streptacidiphilus TaxID=2643834 RepID=UPI0035148E5D